MTVKEFFSKMKNQYENCFLPISELSMDDTKNEVLCHSERTCLGYDALIKRMYEHKRFPSTVDAIAIGDGYLNFIEFKNCHINDKERANIRQKVFEGTYVFEHELIEKTFFENLDMKTRFVLVYSDKHNQCETKSQKEINDGILDLANISINMPWRFQRFIGDTYHKNFRIFTTSMSISDKEFMANLDRFVAKENDVI